jgi:hypothetical protein
MTVDPRLQRIVAAQPYPLLFATNQSALNELLVRIRTKKISR